jgi:flavin reductase (DIM6/NTAB) family NADH-FMN oxidoreductase RutF
MKKVLLVDAVGCLVNLKGNINHKIKNLIQKFDNKKIVLTNADDREREIFLKKISYEIFTLKHKPNKSDPKYYKKFLSKFRLKPYQVVYIEHDLKAVKSAKNNGIITHHFDGDIKKLQAFLNLFLNKHHSYPTKDNLNFHYYPHQPVILGVNDGKKFNFMPCVWNTGLSYDPFLYGVAVKKERYTNKILKKKKFFSINFLDFKHVKLIRALGRSTGRLVDKTKEFKINYSKGFNSNIPILTDAYLSFECKKILEKRLGTHTLYVGEVQLIHTDNKISKKSILDVQKVSPTLYLGADHYISINKKSLLNLKSLPFHKSYSVNRIKLVK